MANVNFPFGLRPINKDYRWVKRPIASGYGTALFKGDPVEHVAGGGIEKATLTTDSPWAGVIVGFVDPYGGTAGNFPGNDAGWFALVCEDPDQYYEIQEDSDSGDLGLADVNINAIAVVGPGGNADNGCSSVMLDSSSKATTATHQLRVIGPVESPDNEVGQVYARWIVRINKHAFADGSVGV